MWAANTWRPDLHREAVTWLREGRLPDVQTTVPGLHNAPEAILGMLKGQNIGKMLGSLSLAAVPAKKLVDQSVRVGTVRRLDSEHHPEVQRRENVIHHLIRTRHDAAASAGAFEDQLNLIGPLTQTTLPHIVIRTEVDDGAQGHDTFRRADVLQQIVRPLDKILPETAGIRRKSVRGQTTLRDRHQQLADVTPTPIDARRIDTCSRRDRGDRHLVGTALTDQLGDGLMNSGNHTGTAPTGPTRRSLS